MTAREAALTVLYETEANAGYLNLVFSETLKKHPLSSADTALAKELVFGVYRQKILLDYVIRKNSSLRLKKIEPKILTVLRMGVYQIYYMDKIPDHAVVSESVALAKKYGRGGRVPGFVNAVLRSVLRTLPQDKKIDFSDLKDPLERLSVKFSYPLPLTKFFAETFKERAATLLAAGNETPPLCIRVNTLKTDRDKLAESLQKEGIATKPTPFTDCGLYLFGANESARRTLSELFTVQDQSSQLASLALAPQPGDFVLDLCAAPGGKTTHLAELMQNDGQINAFDLYEKRLLAVEKSAKRLSLSIIHTKAHDASVLMPGLIGRADKILLDVPCSGLGIIRRKPDIKYKEDITDFSSLLKIQRSILDTAKQYLKPGGSMVYSTCTVNPSENQLQIEQFLKENPDFTTEPIQSEHITGDIREQAKSGMLTLFPDLHQTDGFFVCKLKKQENQ